MNLRALLLFSLAVCASAQTTTTGGAASPPAGAVASPAAGAPSSSAVPAGAIEPTGRVMPGTPAPPVDPAVDVQGAQYFVRPEGVVAATHAPLFPTPAYFKKTFDPPLPRVALQPPVRVADFAVDGKLELSLRSYLELVLANNTDIAIQRLSVETFKNAITRNYAPFDPVAIASFASTRQQTPTGSALEGAAILNTLNQPLRLSYQQRLETGTLYNVGFTSNKISTNNAFANFNPLLNTGLNVNFIQPLLRDRGSMVTRLPIMIARSRLRQSEYTLEDQVMQLLQNAENAYWDVILARETLKVQEQNLALQDTALKRAQRELELGAISQLEVYQPQASYANAEIFVTQARYRLAQFEDALRRQMGADLDPALRKLPIVLTESADPPADNTPFDREVLVEQALAKRQDLRATLQQSDIDDLTLKAAKNALLPDLSLTGQYGSSGRGGTFYERSDVFGGQSQIVNIVPGGLGDSLNQVFGFNFPVYGFGLNLRLPIRDRRASADLADALVSQRLTALRTRNVEQNVRLQVLNAINNVENSRASVELARIALDFAEKRLEADQKRYDLGTINIFFLLAANADLTQAQSNVVNQSVQYRRNLLNLLRVSGQLLDERGVRIQ